MKTERKVQPGAEARYSARFVPNNEGKDDNLAGCELFVEKQGERVCLPFPNNPPDGVMRVCGAYCACILALGVPPKPYRVCNRHYDRISFLRLPVSGTVQ